MQTNEWWNTELKIIGPHNLGDDVRHILEWVKLVVGIDEMLLLQMLTNFVAQQELL